MKTLFTGISEDRNALRQRYGEEVTCTPLIEIAAVADRTALRATCEDIDRYDYLLFTSRFAVRHYVRELTFLPGTLRVVSIGATTTKALHQEDIGEVEQVGQDNSYGVVEWFRQQPRGRVLFPRSDIALPIITDGLQALGFDVHAVTAYVNRMPQHPVRVDLDDFDRIVFTSPSTVRHFVMLYGALPVDKKLEARGPITQQAIINQLNKQL